ncbi:hypothetical protein ColTof4_07902 [Colletotrichum tofieldiae]|nr:hypothetical protein ColTof3_02572 [Colletotrichum tofieldiae]GKT75479.1 hypothetical protein ColTof4_07902 [Colletotrichum tofieldiae]
MIDGFDSYDMNDIKSPLDRLPSIIRQPSFFGDTPLTFPSTETDGKGKQKGPDGGKPTTTTTTTTAEKDVEDPRARKDSVMTGVEGSTSGSSSVSVSSVSSRKRPAVTVRKRVLGVDEKGESSRSAREVPRAYDNDGNKEKDTGKGSVGNSFGEIWPSRPIPRDSNAAAPNNALQLAPRPSTVAPRRSRFVEGLEGLEGVRTEAVGRTPAEVCQRICLPDQTRTAAKGHGVIEQYFPPAVTPQEEPQAAPEKDEVAPATPSPKWCHHDGGCLQRKGRRRRNLARAVVRLVKKPTRWNREDKGKKRAACEICGDDTRLDLRDCGRDEEAREVKDGSSVAAEVAAMLSQLYDRDEAESSRRCSVCGQKVGEELVWERDEDSREERSDGTTLGSRDDAMDSSSKAAVGLTEIPEAWWTRRFRR